MSRYVVRFSKKQRAEHLIVMMLFVTLAVTGFPQKYYETRWAGILVNAIGGLDRLRFFHRMAGLLFCVVTIFHVVWITVFALARKAGMTMVPTRRDFQDAIRQIRWYLGLAEAPAKFDRYDYRQKFEYWGMLIGSLVMVVTGLVLYLPLLFTRFFPGELVPVAQVAHSNEGLMAFLVVITWHIYNAHLSPDVFPFDTTIFTGRISEERMHHEHPLELARLTGVPEEGAGGDDPSSGGAAPPA